MIHEIIAKSWGELQRVANTVSLGLGQAEVWFRGHANDDWKLRPRAFREFNRSQELKLFGMFKQRAVGLHGRCPGESDDDIGHWLCLMRHYGLPTRLLDWTRSLSVATFFATARERGKGNAIIWATSPLRLNGHLLSVPHLITLSHSKLTEVVRGAQYKRNEIDLVGAVTAPDLDMRMVAQQSAFTIHGSSLPLECYTGCENFLYKIVIPEESRAHYTVALRQFGIRLTSVYPDLPSLAEELVGDELYGGALFGHDLAAGSAASQVSEEIARRGAHAKSLEQYMLDYAQRNSAR